MFYKGNIILTRMHNTMKFQLLNSLISQWNISQLQSNSCVLRHKYSLDLCKISTIVINQKQLQTYVSRKLYNHPYTPRLYDFSIKAIVEQSLTLELLTQCYPHNLQTSQFQFSLFQINNVLQAIKFLVLKYGFFVLLPHFVGQTPQGVIKVWINEDVTSNTISHLLSNQYEMVSNLITLLKLKLYFHKEALSSASTIDHLIELFSKAINNAPLRFLKQNQSILVPAFQLKKQSSSPDQFTKAKNNDNSIQFSRSKSPIQFSSYNQINSKSGHCATPKYNPKITEFSKINITNSTFFDSNLQPIDNKHFQHYTYKQTESDNLNNIKHYKENQTKLCFTEKSKKCILTKKLQNQVQALFRSNKQKMNQDQLEDEVNQVLFR